MAEKLLCAKKHGKSNSIIPWEVDAILFCYPRPVPEAYPVGQPPCNAVLRPMSQPGQVSEEGKPIFPFTSSVGSFTIVVPVTL